VCVTSYFVSHPPNSHQITQEKKRKEKKKLLEDSNSFFFPFVFLLEGLAPVVNRWTELYVIYVANGGGLESSIPRGDW